MGQLVETAPKLPRSTGRVDYSDQLVEIKVARLTVQVYIGQPVEIPIVGPSYIGQLVETENIGLGAKTNGVN